MKRLLLSMQELPLRLRRRLSPPRMGLLRAAAASAGLLADAEPEGGPPVPRHLAVGGL